jgi:SPP1 gp7 family putative phage head morphogenesis protein
VSRHLLACCGVDAADTLAAHLKLPVEKAIDPLDPNGFLRIVARLSASLQGVAREHEAPAMRAALRALDVDWKNLTDAQREAVVQAARRSLEPLPAAVLPKLEEKFTVVGGRVIKDTRKESIREFGLKIGISMSQRDLDAERFVRANAANFITDAYGNRLDELAATARELVARGLEEGMGSEAISALLNARLGDQVMRGKDYWLTVAMSFANQARTFSQLNAYADAGIQKYSFEAILDEVTTDQCRFYHGRIFSVGNAINLATRIMQATKPEDVKSMNPWVRTGKDEEGKRILFIERDGQRVVLAQVERSGYGGRDDLGDYSNAVPTSRLEQEGIPWPPLHGKCRSTIVPEVS